MITSQPKTPVSSAGGRNPENATAACRLAALGAFQFLWSKGRFAAWLALLTAPLLAPAQPYTMDWFTVEGGGGTSSSGPYSLCGTIGQPDAGVMSGGDFTLQGGFWGVVAAVQTPGAPLLTVTRSNAVVIVSWSAPADGWMLHATTNLVTRGCLWTDIRPPYQTNSFTNISIVEPAPVGYKFYRLHKP